jgi:hypothetical protein
MHAKTVIDLDGPWEAVDVCPLHNGHGARARLHAARPGGVRHGEGARLQLSSACIREQPTWASKGMDGMDGIVQTRSQPLNPSHIRTPAMARSGHRPCLGSSHAISTRGRA